MKTIVLLSGGLDSATVLAACAAEGRRCLALGFDYGQPHKIELERAEQIAAHFLTPFKIMPLPEAPKVNDVVFAGRNLMLASVAIAVAQANGHNSIAVGCNASDWERFPDCRPEFWKSLKTCADAYGITVLTPLLYMSKSDVVGFARKLNVPIELTWSCYSPKRVLKGGWGSGDSRDPDNHGFTDKPCGECLACTTRQEALA